MAEGGPVSQVDAFGRPVEPKTPTPPRWLLLARRLWVAGVLVGFAGSFVRLSDRSALVADLRQHSPELRQDQVDSAVTSGIASSLMMSALSLLVYVMLSTRMVQGRNWARIVLTVLGGLNALGTAMLLLLIGALGFDMVNRLAGGTFTGVDIAFSVVIMFVNLAAIVLMFHPECNAYFRELRGRGPKQVVRP
ncbi:hypothetical protein HUO13_34960 [Saccharopolyspora erythraea]|nr:hypothetical protein HUO13_34960 [Saccharopolyspora erythraea]